MHDNEVIEQELVQAKLDLIHEEIPQDIDLYILEGIRKGREQRFLAKIRYHRRIWTGASVFIFLISCLFTLRISPVFASIIRDIPGLEIFVNLIRSTPDKGLHLALDNEFVQPVGVFDEHDGIKFTVEGIIADEVRAVIFYSIAYKAGGEPGTLLSSELSDLAGQPLSAMVTYGSPDELNKKDTSNVHRGTIDLQLNEGMILPDQISLKAKINGATGNDEFKTIIFIDHSKFIGMKTDYILNKTIDIEDQRITFVKATIDPLRISVKLDYDEKNSKQVFGAGDIHLVDEKGAVWKSYSGSGTNLIYFESNYFHFPKELYLEGEWFRAFDKDKMKVVIDTDQKRLIAKPDSLLSLVDVTSYGTDLYKMTLSLQVNHDKDNMAYSMMLDNHFTDADGGAHLMVNSPNGNVWGSSGDQSLQQIYYYLDNKTYKQPLTFQLYMYPNYIHQAYKIKIK